MKPLTSPFKLLRWSRHWRGWPLMLAASVIVLFVVGAATVRESYRGWKVDREIKALEAQADELEGRNARLKDLADALRSPERLEVEAHTRLGLRQPGEHVVILTGLAATGSWQGSLAFNVLADKPAALRSNATLWWDYFFHPERLKE